TVLSRDTTPAVYASTYLAKAVLLAFTVIGELYFQRKKAIIMTMIMPPAAMRVVLRAGIQLALFIVTDFTKANVHKRGCKFLKPLGGNSKIAVFGEGGPYQCNSSHLNDFHFL